MYFSEDLKKAVCHYSGQDGYFDQDYFLPDDIFLASYPRSGSHFVRFIIASAFNLTRKGKLPHSLAAVTSITDLHRHIPHHTVRQPMIIKTHFPMDPRYRRVIHILRDPRDVAGSYYHYTREEYWHYFIKPAAQPAFEDFIGHFLAGNLWPCSWELHTQTFTDMTDETSRHLTIYERLLDNPTEEIDSLLQFVGLKLDSASLNRLAEHASFENMNKLFNLNEVRDATGFNRRDKILKTGRAGGHHSLYDEALLARMEPLFRLYHDQTTQA